MKENFDMSPFKVTDTDGEVYSINPMHIIYLRKNQNEGADIHLVNEEIIEADDTFERLQAKLNESL